MSSDIVFVLVLDEHGDKPNARNVEFSEFIDGLSSEYIPQSLFSYIEDKPIVSRIIKEEYVLFSDKKILCRLILEIDDKPVEFNSHKGRGYSSDLQWHRQEIIETLKRSPDSHRG